MDNKEKDRKKKSEKSVGIDYADYTSLSVSDSGSSDSGSSCDSSSSVDCSGSGDCGC